MPRWQREWCSCSKRASGNFFLVGSRLAIEGYATSVLVNQPRDGRFAELVDAYRLKYASKRSTRDRDARHCAS